MIRKEIVCHCTSLSCVHVGKVQSKRIVLHYILIVCLLCNFNRFCNSKEYLDTNKKYKNEGFFLTKVGQNIKKMQLRGGKNKLSKFRGKNRYR